MPSLPFEPTAARPASRSLPWHGFRLSAGKPARREDPSPATSPPSAPAPPPAAVRRRTQGVSKRQGKVQRNVLRQRL